MSGEGSESSLSARLGNPSGSATAEARHGFGATDGDSRHRNLSPNHETRDGGCFSVVAVLILSVGEYLYLHRPPPKLTDKDTIVLADFANTTGDPVFDGTLRQGLAVQLEQSPFLNLISEERMQAVLRLMGQPSDARLTPGIARDICERTGSVAVLDGTIASLGSQYVVGLRAKDCHTGNVLVEEQIQTAKKEDVLNALGEIASKFRSRVGESLTTVQKYNTPLAEATTSSMEALKAYSAGWQVAWSKRVWRRHPVFQARH